MYDGWARLKSVDVHVSPLITLETANADHVLEDIVMRSTFGPLSIRDATPHSLGFFQILRSQCTGFQLDGR